ncbi:MAG TPA: hypothetical protein VH684_16590 [Xanthobacteraceae bacterium]|jgi:hypothetical protein
MARNKLCFRQSDLTRAIKGAIRAGVGIAKIEVDTTGKISIIPGPGKCNIERNEWDELFDGANPAQVR